METTTSSSAVKEDQIVEDSNHSSSTEKLKTTENHDQNFAKEDGNPSTTFITTIDVNHKDFDVPQPKVFNPLKEIRRLAIIGSVSKAKRRTSVLT